MKCRNCGTEVIENARFCQKCGTKLIKNIDEYAADLKHGKKSAFDEIFKETYGEIKSMAWGFFYDEMEAEDAASELYIHLLNEKIQKYDETRPFLPWFYRVARNYYIDRWRKKPKKQDVLFSQLENEETGDGPEFVSDKIEFSPDAKLERDTIQQLIREILDELPEIQRKCIILYYFNGEKQESIAEILNIPVGTVRSRLYYGKQNIETKVKELEKKGTKLYSMVPFVFFLWLFEQKKNSYSVQAAESFGKWLGQHKDLLSLTKTTAKEVSDVYKVSKTLDTTSKVTKVVSGTAKAGQAAATITGKAIGVKIVSAVAIVAIGAGSGNVVYHQVEQRQIAAVQDSGKKTENTFEEELATISELPQEDNMSDNTANLEIPEEAVELDTILPAETVRSTETDKPTDSVKPTEESNLAEETKSTEEPNLAEETKSTEEPKSAEEAKLTEELKMEATESPIPAENPEFTEIPITEAVSVSSEASENLSGSDQSFEKYKDILMAYRTVIDTGVRPDIIPYDSGVRSLETRYSYYDTIYVAFYDVNGDGIEECFISEDYSFFRNTGYSYFLDVWTWSGGTPKHLFGGWENGNRVNLCENGILRLDGHNSAFDVPYDYYYLNDKLDIEPVGDGKEYQKIYVDFDWYRILPDGSLELDSAAGQKGESYREEYVSEDIIEGEYIPVDTIGREYGMGDFLGEELTSEDVIGENKVGEKEYIPVDTIGRGYGTENLLGDELGSVN